MRTTLGSLCLVMVLSFGCNKEGTNGDKGAPSATPTGSTSAPLAAASTSASTAPSAMKKHRRAARGGVVGMLFRATDDLQLDAAKKTKVDDLEKQLHPAGPSPEMKALHDEITAEVKAGKIDEKKIDDKKADVDKVMKEQHDKQADALNQLHATLDGAQRKTVVAKVREDLAKRDEQMAKWKEKAEAKGKDDKDKKQRMVEHMTKELDLDAAQQKKVEAIAPKDDDWKPDFDAMKKHETELLDGFEKDDFDAKKLAPPEMGKKMHGPMDAKFLSQLVAILKPEQREKLAASMSKMGGPHGGPGMHGPGMMGPGMMGPGTMGPGMGMPPGMVPPGAGSEDVPDDHP